MSLRINSEAPNFTAETTEGPIDFHKWIGDGYAILFSHPKDFTPVCTTELGYMARIKPEFDRRNTKIIGLSVDPVADHAKWAEDIKETQGFARLFMAPGVTHCGGGPGANVFNGPDNLGGPEDANHDVFLALRQWVEQGVAPTRIIGTKYVNDTPASGVAFTRPMCPYPQQARYRGAGATTDATTFACVSDESDSNGPIIADFGKRETILGYAALLFR